MLLQSLNAGCFVEFNLVDRRNKAERLGNNGGSFAGWLGKYNKLLAKGVNRSAVAPAMMASTERGSWNCDNASIAERFDRVVADRVEEIAIFTFDPLSW